MFLLCADVSQVDKFACERVDVDTEFAKWFSTAWSIIDLARAEITRRFTHADDMSDENSCD